MDDIDLQLDAEAKSVFYALALPFLCDGDSHLADIKLQANPEFNIDKLALRELFFIDTTTGELV